LASTFTVVATPGGATAESLLATGTVFTAVTVRDTVACVLVLAAAQPPDTGAQLSGSPRSVTVYRKLSDPL
jgi:hypothetical protein